MKTRLKKGWYLIGLIASILLTILACQFPTEKESAGIAEGKPFSPEENINIQGGSYHVESVNIPSSVTVSFDGAVEMIVDGDMVVEGNIVSECGELRFDVGGSFNISGVMKNECEADVEDIADIFIHIKSDTASFGTDGGSSEIVSSGDIEILIGPDREPWEYDLFPDARSTEKLPPVCFATADRVFEMIDEDTPAEIEFLGKGIDPDGGPVSLTWIFARINGDHTTAEGPNPIQTFDREGLYDVHLTGIDDEGETCNEAFTIAINDIDEEEAFTFGVSFEPSSLAASVGETIFFSPNLYSDSEEGVEYHWWIDDVERSEETLAYSFAEPGRHTIYLEVFDKETGFSIASTASIYIYATPDSVASVPHNARDVMAYDYDCITPDPETIYFREGWKSRGRHIKIDLFPVAARPIVFFPGVELEAEDGKSWAANPKSGKGMVVGKNGGRGGSIIIRNYSFDLVFCGGTTLAAGSGGDGQDATSVGDEGKRDVYARGGKGGRPGNISLWAFSKVVIQGTGFGGFQDVTLAPGNGGDGGDAFARGGNGKDDCALPGKGGNATAIGGKGGSTSYVLTPKVNNRNGGIIVIAEFWEKSGNAGDGGSADAVGGKGGNAKKANGDDCDMANAANGARGGRAEAVGGQGGNAELKGYKNPNPSSAEFEGGDGGYSYVKGGNGGDGATRKNQDTGTHGGAGGEARGKPGKWGTGKTNGETGTMDPDSCGGDGGKGGDGQNQGGNGGKVGNGRGNLPDGKKGADGGTLAAATVEEPEEQEPGVEATLEPTPGEPVITDIEFPIGEPRKINLADNEGKIPADGSEVWGLVRFESPVSEIKSAWFDALDEWTIWEDFGFDITELVEGGYHLGAFEFWLSCGTPGFYSFGVTIEDQDSNWSKWAVFMFECE